MGKQLSYRKLSTEEKLNVLTHGLGFILSVIGFGIIAKKLIYAPIITIFSSIIYVFTLCFMYMASTLYHLAVNFELKQKLRTFDHIAIYLLIAGTYTPVVLLKLNESKGYLLFGLVWGIAIFGIILKIFYTGRFGVLSTIIYAIMGWLIVIDYYALKSIIGQHAVLYLEWGGIFYTIGIIFYALKSFPFTHSIWHLFVCLGSLFHFYFIYKFIVA